jgi:hypothetical protein
MEQSPAVPVVAAVAAACGLKANHMYRYQPPLIYKNSLDASE